MVAGSIISAAGCRQEESPPNPRIEKLTFTEREKTIYAGDTVIVGMAVEPKEAKQYDKIVYKATDKGVIDIKEESGNDGVVFEGLKRGSTIIKASASYGNVIDYCQVKVLGAAAEIPYINGI